MFAFFSQETDQLKFPEYVIAVLSIPKGVTDKDIISAFQVFDPDKRGLLEADEILKSLTNVGEQLDEIEVNTFKENMNINEVGLFDYNGTRKKKQKDVFSLKLFIFLEFVLKFTQPPETKTKKKGKKKKKKKK